jgi:hypothetical protein
MRINHEETEGTKIRPEQTFVLFVSSWLILRRSFHVALRRSETKKIDMIYKIDKMGRKKINPVNLVNNVYFRRSFHVAMSDTLKL